ncbi:hypothetical protein TrRE_jg4315 [Triparma retinervis]|uniref:Elongator complex protein 4 n=1 Tax=Triparma retinervis TaxID=2557542 RepID=A0A9W7L5X5_9STRA|nr:hypothetical protein TrRE_jg4315 [Triparma retinervis]
MSQPITLAFYRRCLRSLRVLSQNKENLSLGFDVDNEVSSRSNYYRSWAQENILSHTDIGGQNLLSAIERGEGKGKEAAPSSVAPAVSLRGTKPWINSTTLISSGQRDLDSILGGGQVLGTSTIVLEDRWTDFGSTLGRYWAAEGISNGQQLIVVDFEDMYDEEDRQNCAKGFLSSLPLDMNFAKKERREQQQQQQQQQQLDAESSSSAVQQPSLSLAEISLAEGNEDDEEDDFEEEKVDTLGDDHLKVAWQYKTSIQRENHGSSSLSATPVDPYYCHSFDLSKTIQQVHIDSTPPIYKNLFANSYDHAELFKALVAAITEATELSTTNRVVRLILRRPPFRSTSAALTLIKSYVRANKLPVAIFVLVEPWKATRVDGFGGLVTKPPGEFKDFAAIFTVLKIGTKTGVSTRRPAAMRWGIKRDRRKLHIKMLHLPPEDYSDRGGSVGGGARSGAGGEGGGTGDDKGRGKGGGARMACSSGFEF